MKIKQFISFVALLTIVLPAFAIEQWAGGSSSNVLSSAGGLSSFSGLQDLTGKLGGDSGGGAATGVPNNIPSAVSKKTVSHAAISRQAFDSMVNHALPMSPEQIVQLHALFNKTQRAVATDPSEPPRPVSRTLPINLSPGITPPVIRLSAGFISSLVFVDSTGAPWPIAAYDLGDPKDFNVSWNQKDNLLLIQALTLAKHANLMIKLRKLSTPIMLTLVPDQRAVDYRVDMQVPGIGPNAKALPITNGLPSGADPLLLNILNGVPPVGAKPLTVTGAKSQAWLFHRKLYLRTKYQVLSPGWLAVMSSADGTNAYLLPRAPLVLLNGHGKTISVKIAGF